MNKSKVSAIQRLVSKFLSNFAMSFYMKFSKASHTNFKGNKNPFVTELLTELNSWNTCGPFTENIHLCNI